MCVYCNWSISWRLWLSVCVVRLQRVSHATRTTHTDDHLDFHTSSAQANFPISTTHADVTTCITPTDVPAVIENFSTYQCPICGGQLDLVENMFSHFITEQAKQKERANALQKGQEAILTKLEDAKRERHNLMALFISHIDDFGRSMSSLSLEVPNKALEYTGTSQVPMTSSSLLLPQPPQAAQSCSPHKLRSGFTYWCIVDTDIQYLWLP